MRSEVISAERNAAGQYEAETLWLLTDAEVSQLNRTGLVRQSLDRNELTRVHHVLSPARSATRAQRIITRADGFLLHQDGSYYDPLADPPWTYTSSGSGLNRWTRPRNGQVAAYLFPRTSDDEDEYLDPQWQRQTFTRDPATELSGVADWKGSGIDAQLTRGDPIPVRQRTTLNLQCGQGQDDAHERTDSGSLNHGDSQLIFGSVGFNYHNGMRFPSVSGLSGATIDTTTLVFRANATDTGTMAGTFYAHDTAAPGVFDGAGDISGRTRTTASDAYDQTQFGNWTSGNDESVTLDTGVIQEIADSHDPSAIAILAIYSSGSGERLAVSYDNNSSLAPKLDIDFTAGGGGGSGASRMPLLHVG